MAGRESTHCPVEQREKERVVVKVSDSLLRLNARVAGAETGFDDESYRWLEVLFAERRAVLYL